MGELTGAQCAELAAQTADLDYPGVVGVEDIAPAFTERERPIHPGIDGTARLVEPEDIALFADWMTAFFIEAVPHGPRPQREDIERTIVDQRFQFWIAGGEPVAMAGIVRRTRHAAAIAGVYTPPALRGRGYAAAATAAVVERIVAEGRTTACLYSDLRNPAANRCYAKIGFRPVCRAWHYLRA